MVYKKRETTKSDTLQLAKNIFVNFNGTEITNLSSEPIIFFLNRVKNGLFGTLQIWTGPQINKSLYLSVIKSYMLEKHMERIKHHIWEIRDALI